MTETMTMGGMEFEALLQEALRVRRVEAEAPAGLEQRLLARLAQAAELSSVRPFAFAESVQAGRRAGSLWTAMLAHAAVLLAVLGLASWHGARVGMTRSVTSIRLSTPPLPARLKTSGGGGGAHDVAAVTQGRLPKIAAQPIVAPKAPPAIPPKLAVEPSVVVQPDLKMTAGTLPNLGIPNAPAATVGSLGTGEGGGIGSGTGNGVGAGAGGNMAGGVYHIGGGVRPPVVITEVEPEFSEEARKAKFSGNVLVGLIVDEHGMPSHVRVLRGVGLGLDERAVEAVRQYRFAPATKDGRPVKVDLSVDVYFQIF